ncbi:hypothetical protein BCR36DRAFT_367921 [Piromyces finnis]|uniref:Talin N-terminal F0 domain-containing protein n=1 Tax=Piromyces finnis TaxID=1754191 RepID=A0A1Y1VHA4_9FUNG|nr:hypothetical protein BCR36DRAFT_367921 [Piromyces finnis]|eukprot:ORX56089.1 hypothetical protein BCR36DRAFT_367921 [Piromyces finnis]
MSSENNSLGQIQTTNIRNSNDKLHDGYSCFSPQYSNSIGRTSFRKHGSGRTSNFMNDTVSSSLSSLNSPILQNMSKYSNPNVFYNSFKSSDSILSPFEHKDYTTNSTTKKSFMDTDELKLKLHNEIESVTVNIPSLKIQVSLKFNQELSIKEAIKTLQSNLKSEERYGLYNKNLGFWLDDNKLLSSYDLTEDTILELRALAEEFFIRILDVENDSRFALRALPGFLVSDVLAMINNTVINRKIKHNSKNGIYGLKRKGRWMEENKTLEQFNEMKYTLHEQQECLEYQLQYEMIKVQTCDGIHNVLVDQSTTIGDLIELVCLIDPNGEENQYQIVSPSGEHFSNDENIWKLISEDAILETDKLLFKPAPKPITLSSPIIGNDIRLEFMLDFSQPLSMLIPYICRRIGIRFTDFEFLRLEDGIGAYL